MVTGQHYEHNYKTVYKYTINTLTDCISNVESGYSYDSESDAKSAGRSYINSHAKEWAKTYFNYVKNNKNKCFVKYSFNGLNPCVIEKGISGIIQPTIIVELASGEETLTPPCVTWNTSSFHLIGTDCTVQIGGKVWEDIKVTKESNVNGKLGGEDTMYGGMQVDLLLNGSVVASTSTDSYGKYHFYNLNALKKYQIRFTFNGQLYEQTYYNDNLSGGYSNANENDRSGFNDRFDKIDSYPSNYYLNGSWHIAYGTNTKLKKDDGTYISNGTDSSGTEIALMYIDAWNQFVSYATRQENLNNAKDSTINDTDSSTMKLTGTKVGSNENAYSNAYSKLDSWMAGKGVGSTDRAGVIQFIKDCMITSTTRQYPVYDYFIIEDLDKTLSQPISELHAGRTWNSLYIKSSDQSRNVDFGIVERDTADLALQKDVYKATVRMNGKTQTYMYNKKDANVENDGTWNVEVRQSDSLYNGVYTYNREIRKSEYLYDGSIYSSGGTSAKDLQVFVTYRIVIRNQSQTYATVVNEIVDYFDQNEYSFDGELNDDGIYEPHEYNEYTLDDEGNPKTNEDGTYQTTTYVTSYVGDRNGKKIGDLKITNTSTLGNGVGDTNLGDGYKPIYLSGITKPDGGNRLSTGELAYVYLTFKVNTHTDENGMPNRVQMDVDTSTGDLKGVGKRNIAEINGYSTYYKDGITTPGGIKGGDPAGSIDLDSTVGNLTSQDLNANGDIIITDNPVTNRAEDDSDNAPHIKLVFPESDAEERVITGYVYEDNRDTASDEATVGNGVYDEGETKINGVTVQLVELVQEVDADGIATGKYLGEYIWNAKVWNGTKWIDTNSSGITNGSLRYYSGQKETVSPIICGPGATAVPGYEITEDGQYAFKSVPTGDLMIRFVYGDTTQTTLTTTGGEGGDVATLLQTSASESGTIPDNDSGYISTEGLNAKSYNGQDYKSTAYQRNLTDGTSVPQTSSYNGVNGYVDYEVQNYKITGQGLYQPSVVNTTDGTDKNVMYYYDIGESQVYSGISDAKDVANIRDNETAYSKGITDIDGVSEQTITNRRAEVLRSGLDVSGTSYVWDEEQQKTVINAQEQISMLKELMNNTAMISQTGVINTEVEYNTSLTGNQGDYNVIDYVIDDVDLGLEERPVSQLQLNKEITNVKITLADGTIMFDTGKSVTNLPYATHDGHSGSYQNFGGNAYRLIGVVLGNNSVNIPELITTYMDEELMYGARIELQYKFTVTNIGEVSYLDKTFYYTGKTTDTSKANIATTSANKVIDYVSNNLQYQPTKEENSDWDIRTVEELTGRGNANADDTSVTTGEKQDLVNAKYETILGTYNTILTTDDLSNALYPNKSTVVSENETEISTTMLLSTTLVPDTGDDSMVYNNLCEIVQSSNTQGRRMKFSTPGNQPMADQSLDVGTTVVEDDLHNNYQYTKADLVTPTEIDADSSQKVLILPPTGSDKNYVLWITIGIVALALIAGGVVLIKKFNKKK